MPVMSLPVPCIRGDHGPDLDIFQTTIAPGDLENFLGHDPRGEYWKQLPENLREMYEYLQRKTSSQRRAGTAKYTEDRLGPNRYYIGGYPAISIGMTSPARFETLKDRAPGIDADMGVVHIDLSNRNTRVLLDGLARVSGVLDVYDSDPDTYSQGLNFAVTIFAPKEQRGRLTLDELGQLFHDMNFKQTSVTKAHALALDRSDIYTVLTNAVGELPVIKRAGGMEVRASSLGKKSTAIVVQQVLRRFVRGATEGKSVQMDDKSTPNQPHLTAQTREQFKQEIEALLEGFSTRMGDRFLKRDSLHLSSAGWQALGLVFHDIMVRLKGNLTSDERDTILTDFASADWSRFNPDWIPLLGQPELDDSGSPVLDDKGRQRVALGRGGRQTVWAIADYLREKSILGRLLESRASRDDPDSLPQQVAAAA
jgi:hypothetical protein